MSLDGNSDFLGYFFVFGRLSSLLPFQFDDLNDLGGRPFAVLVHQLGIVVFIEVYVLVVSAVQISATTRLFTVADYQGIRGTVRLVLFRKTF